MTLIVIVVFKNSWPFLPFAPTMNILSKEVLYVILVLDRVYLWTVPEMITASVSWKKFWTYGIPNISLVACVHLSCVWYGLNASVAGFHSHLHVVNKNIYRYRNVISFLIGRNRVRRSEWHLITWARPYTKVLGRNQALHFFDHTCSKRCTAVQQLS